MGCRRNFSIFISSWALSFVLFSFSSAVDSDSRVSGNCSCRLHRKPPLASPPEFKPPLASPPELLPLSVIISNYLMWVLAPEILCFLFSNAVFIVDFLPPFTGFVMGKNEFLTPKAIANRIKAKGLQKLRWYCQMCQKQCRDENGFKCHCMSEGHQRQMQIFGQNPHRIVEGYSEEFESTFLEHMKRSHRFSRVAATVVYNEYINDRHHVHMNSTQWATLTEFVKYLGRTGKCKVEETPKGWFITYIDRDSETLFKERMKNKRIKADMADEEKQEKEIKKQIEMAEQMIQQPTPEADQPLQSEPPRELNMEDGIKIGFSLGSSLAKQPVTKEKREASRVVFEEVDEERYGERNPGNNLKRKESGGGKSTLDEMMRDEEKKKEKINRKDYWLHEGIVVKVMSKVLAEKGYYKQKGVVRKVIDKYVGEIEMLESKHVLRVDQAELETVIPQVGGRVKIVNGAYRGSIAKLLGVDTDNFCAKVQIEKGPYDGRILKAMEYEDISQIFVKLLLVEMESELVKRRIHMIAAHFSPKDDISTTHVLPMGGPTFAPKTHHGAASECASNAKASCFARPAMAESLLKNSVVQPMNLEQGCEFSTLEPPTFARPNRQIRGDQLHSEKKTCYYEIGG
ncbi:hypothetical protein VNO80_21751 [Phaseolus coccineus]|uniref:KIN17-like protein n=1 Tax=Phaseolus coccineus TaxID=3886 RepID=A0AAN9QTM2_PHACN